MRVYKKIKKCGDIVAITDYEKGFQLGFSKTLGLIKLKNAEGKNEYYRPTADGELIQVKIGRQLQGQCSLERSKEIRFKTLTKAKNMIKDLINSNAYAWTDSKGRTLRPKFLTLTFKENVQDLKQANKEFKKFIMRLNYYIKKEIDNDFMGIQYVVVVEFQKRGAVHYHALFFNMPFIPWKTLLDKWGLGGAYIEGFKNQAGQVVEMTYDDEKQCFMANKSEVHNVGAYITKTMEYMTKSIDDHRLKGQKCYFTSRKLKKPIVLNDVPKNKKRIEQLTATLSNENLVFTNMYVNDHIGACHYKEYNIKFKDISNRNMHHELIDKAAKHYWGTNKSISHIFVEEE